MVLDFLGAVTVIIYVWEQAQLQREQQLRSQLECSTAGAAQELQTRVGSVPEAMAVE